MLTIEKFKARLIRPNHPDWLVVGVDTKDDSQFYILGNGGMGNINCAPIELFSAEVKACVLEMITQGDLYLKEHETYVRIGQEKSVSSFTLKPVENSPQASSSVRKIDGVKK